MKLGIMQPYFFPYIGYWQLLNAVDTYVVYDDVNFIKGGWINRNRILANGNPQYINVILDNPSSNKKINEIKKPSVPVTTSTNSTGIAERGFQGLISYKPVPCTLSTKSTTISF